MTVRPAGLIYAVDDRPPWPILLALGFQHAGLAAVYLVMIVIVFKAAGAPHHETVSAVSLGLIALAVSTTLQAIRKGPIGSGYLALPVFSAIYLGPSVLAAQSVGLPAVFGMTILAGLLEIVLARFLIRLRVLFPPAISGFIVAIVGIQLGLVAMDQVLDVENFDKPDYVQHVIVAGLTLALVVGLSIWSGGMARLLCSAIGIVAGFIIAALMGVIDTEHWEIVAQAPIIALPDPSFVSYSIEPNLLPAFLVAGIAAALRTVGVITTCQKINDDKLRHPDLSKIRGGMVADGLGCMLGGAMGAIGMNSAPSLVGVSKASGATSRYIAFAATGWLLLFAIVPIFASLLLILPNAVIGAALLFTASFMIAGGIQIMVTRNIDARMTYIIGISLLLGLSRLVFHDFFRSLPHVLHPVTNSMLSLSVISALVLHLIFRIGSRRTASIEFEESQRSVEDFTARLEEQGERWNVERDVLARAVSTTKQVLDHIERAHLVTGKLAVKLSYDDFNFVVMVDYRGTMLSLPHVGAKKWSFLEEESFSYGLADFLTAAYPDRMESSAHGEDITITMQFRT